jgi:hypothetical protein
MTRPNKGTSGNEANSSVLWAKADIDGQKAPSVSHTRARFGTLGAVVTGICYLAPPDIIAMDFNLVFFPFWGKLKHSTSI